MIRFRIVTPPDCEPPYLLEPDPKGIVCLAEAALTEIAEARMAPGVADAAEGMIAEGIRQSADWLRKKGRPQTADALLEALL